MNVTRDVIRDLLPAYFAGEASQDTRLLVEEYFRQDPEFERLAREGAATLDSLGKIQDLPPDQAREKSALDKVQSGLRRQRRLFGWALSLTLNAILVGFSFQISSDGHGHVAAHWLQFAIQRDLVLVLALGASILWIIYLRTLVKIFGPPKIVTVRAGSIRQIREGRIMVSTTALNSASIPRKLIAPVWHTLIVLGFIMIPLVSGLILQNRPTPNNQIFASHSGVMLRFYVPVLIGEWLLVLIIWAGVRMRGVTIKELIGGRWQSWRNIMVDIGMAVALWLVLLGIGAALSRLLGPSLAKSTSVILPQGPLETVVWIVVAITAGFVEELVFRGYLQTQFNRMGLPVALAVIAQAVVFGLGHIYEGRNPVITITVFALLFGALAAWRKSLRPGIVGHAWYDIAVILLRS